MFAKNARRRKSGTGTTPTAAAESLEARSLLSATATLENGTLTITGTEGADTVTVLQYGRDQVRVLLGNGEVWGPRSTAGMKAIVANMFGGNDSLTIRPIGTRVDMVQVDMGGGSREYVQVEANYTGSVNINGQGTQLKAVVWNSIGTLRANFGNGTDSLKLWNASVDQIFANLGGGNDVVEMGSFSTARSGRVDLGSGDDRMSVASSSRINADLFGGSGRDYFSAYRKDNSGVRLTDFEDLRWI